MSLHGSDERHLGVSPAGSVMKTGGSLDLPLDTTAVFSKDKRKTTVNGLKALSDFSGIAKNELLTLMFGTKKDTGVMGYDKNQRTVDFSLRNIERVGLSNPKVADQKVDYFRVGWDGVNDNTSFKFHKGQTLEFQMTIGGIAATFFNNVDQYTVRTLINIPNDEANIICEELGDVCEPVDCREHTISMVKSLNNYALPGGDKLSQYYDIYPIFDTPTVNATPVVYKQWCLEYCGFGGEHELSMVSAQYPGQTVTRDTMNNKFVIFAPEAYTPEAYVEGGHALLKGCDDCPEGYDEIAGGFVYGVAIEDAGEDLSATIQALPNAVAASALKTGQDFGVGHYVVVVTTELTAAQEATFIGANPTATIKFVGTKEAFCSDDTTTTHAWVECGECEASTAKYRIMVADDCNGSRLAEIQAANPELTITQVINQNCVSVFETTVQTSFSCDEGCNPAIVQQVFTSEEPKRFGQNNYWYPVEPEAQAGTTKCGFEIKGKPIVMNPGEVFIDELPFVMTSSRIITASGGYPVDYSMNSMVPSGTWSVVPLQRAQDLDNLGGNLRQWEQKGRFYFNDEKPYRSAIDREITGSQTRLKGLTQYSDLFLTIEKDNKAGINDKEYTYITYHVLVPFGKTTDLEELFRNLAGAAGLDFEVK